LDEVLDELLDAQGARDEALDALQDDVQAADLKGLGC
jgi:hypothetical protein